ncbi:S9 family peptidase [Flavobacterium columnare]|uniref:Prolyl tripeptidase A n=2 Tax=Flavobacterium columnare TaxID=996 RepID=G8X928_FLACA|nr:DPP IV N-terminal domain-containing protein [Flavobacterium columnare]AEW85079.1 prolyl tripeptidase A [Flavobacterium columnare ATCC 49512]AMO19466.1 S9 family peptidase [Flavobacterium columnare]ANO49143.1 prolyl tripeptidase A [Flavobacterium columnare]APT22861.1 S9 family peptidase [Flavobacterium columnare]MBF6654567.1 S9 family peptidase [Flavobacterium columnare]
MKKYTFSLLLIGGMTFAQKLTIEETVTGGRKFAPSTQLAQQWRKNSKAITYLSSDFSNLLEKSVSNGWKETILATKYDFEKELKDKINSDDFLLRSFPMSIEWKSIDTFETEIIGKKNNYRVTYDVITKKIINVVTYSNEVSQVKFASNGNVAWLKDNNIQVASFSGNVINVTNDTDKGIVNGSDYVHRQEFGIDRGMWWNEAGTKLAYYRKDETMVANYPLINWNEPEAVNKDIKYPMVGMTNEKVTLVVFDLASGKKVTMQTGEPNDQYLTMVSWEPTGKHIFIGILNREQNHLKFNKYDVQTGAFVKTLFEEKASTWVEPQHPLIFVPTNPSQFIYQTDFNGFNQMYLYNTDGKLLKNLGYKDVVVKEFLGFDEKGLKANYVGTANNGLDRQLYQVDLESGKTTQLTIVSGTHTASVSSDGTMVLDQYNNITTPNEISVIDIKLKKTTQLIKADNPFVGKIDMPKIELVTITSADGKTPLNGRIIYPANFDVTKKYPVMVYVYGGSHAQLVNNRWLGGASYFDLYMAQNGYVVFTMDNRGSDSRGKKFCDVNHRQLGVNEMADQMEGVKFLKSKSFVDQDKIGVFGWSFGGFMTTSLMTSQVDTFKVGVAGGPVIDWKYYEIMYGERYMDTPQENPEGYSKTSLLDKAKNLKGRLLIIHGAQDPVVVQQNSMNFIEACIKAGKQVDYFLYPNHEHNVGGRDRIHLYAKIADYFDTHLKK